jgi:hypothetical protein
MQTPLKSLHFLARYILDLERRLAKLESRTSDQKSENGKKRSDSTAYRFSVLDRLCVYPVPASKVRAQTKYPEAIYSDWIAASGDSLYITTGKRGGIIYHKPCKTPSVEAKAQDLSHTHSTDSAGSSYLIDETPL